MKQLDHRRRAALFLAVCLVLLLISGLAGALLTGRAMTSDLSQKFLPPSPAHLFGTDQLGRDMLSRALSGFSLSLGIGLLTSLVSSLMALVFGLGAATLGRWVDAAVGYLTDLMLGVPHILLLLLVSLAFGRGIPGVLAAMALTHWPAMARLLRGEVLALRERTYIKAAQRLGVGRWALLRGHYLPHLLPQFLTGAVLTLPHAILHESALTFLGFGLSPERPALGVILAESMGYLAAGRWWLALFPGLLLAAAVTLFSYAGEALRILIEPGGVRP